MNVRTRMLPRPGAGIGTPGLSSQGGSPFTEAWGPHTHARASARLLEGVCSNPVPLPSPGGQRPLPTSLLKPSCCSGQSMCSTSVGPAFRDPTAAQVGSGYLCSRALPAKHKPPQSLGLPLACVVSRPVDQGDHGRGQRWSCRTNLGMDETRSHVPSCSSSCESG